MSGLFQTAVQLPSERLVVMLGRRAEIFSTGQFPGQGGGLVDQYRQALRADIFWFTFEGQGEQGDLLFRTVAIQADRFDHEMLQ